jgi:hypothetical protein
MKYRIIQQDRKKFVKEKCTIDACRETVFESDCLETAQQRFNELAKNGVEKTLILADHNAHVIDEKCDIFDVAFWYNKITDAMLAEDEE